MLTSEFIDQIKFSDKFTGKKKLYLKVYQYIFNAPTVQVVTKDFISIAIPILIISKSLILSENKFLLTVIG